MISIVLIDDEFFFRQAMKKYLAEFPEKYRLLGEARNGKEGIQLLRDARPDVALIDINMALQNGIEVTEQVKKEGIESQIIILTGYSEFEYVQKCLRLGVQDYMLKPIDQKQLFEVLDTLAVQIEREKNRRVHYEELQKKLHFNKEILKEKLLQVLLMEQEEGEWNETFESDPDYQKLQHKKIYSVILVYLYEEGSSYWKQEEMTLCRFCLMNVLEEVFGRYQINCFAGKNGKNGVCAILSGNLEEAGMKEAMRNALEELKRIIPMRLRMDVLLCAGMIGKTLDACRKIYQETRSLEKFMKRSNRHGVCYSSRWTSPEQKLGDFQERISSCSLPEENMELSMKIGEYIQEHYGDVALSLDDISRKFAVSKTVICQQFKETAGMTTGEYIQQIRMAAAKRMMEEGYKNIAFIAEKCGYEDAGYFSRRFKKYFGVSPSEYWKLQKTQPFG